jgi:DNA processing protein
MAGISHAVLVVEAETRSGTLITSRLAAEYNRDVLAVPGPIHSATSKGPHMLIKKGAALVGESADILEALGIEKKVEGQPRLPLNLSKDEQALVALLTKPRSRDELIQTCGKNATEANVLLSSLELKGVIEEKMGKVVLR